MSSTFSPGEVAHHLEGVVRECQRQRLQAAAKPLPAKPVEKVAVAGVHAVKHPYGRNSRGRVPLSHYYCGLGW